MRSRLTSLLLALFALATVSGNLKWW